MKKLFALIIGLMIFNIIGFTQSYNSFINVSKKWRYVQTVCLTGSNSCTNIVETDFFKGDTIIDSYNYHKFYRRQDQPYPIKEYVVYFFREDTVSRQVYVYDPKFNETSLFYDFSLIEGDTFDIYVIDDIYLTQTVVKVDTFITYDKKLKRIIFNDSIIWIEGIGSVTRALMPSEGELICMKVNDSVLYINEKYKNCDTIFQDDTSASLRQLKTNNLTVFPNPIEKSSVLRVGTNTNEELMIEIYNYLGVLIIEDRFINMYPIGLINLTKGMYFCRITKQNKIIGIIKIIIK